MSVINLFRTDDAIHIVTDGAGFDGDVVRQYAVKTFPVPHLSCAMAFRGTAVASRFVWMELAERFGTFDDLRAGAGDVLKSRFLWPYRLFRRQYTFELVVGGISERNMAPDAFVIASYEIKPGFAPWTVHRIPRVYMSPEFAGSDRVAMRASNPETNIEALATSAIDRQRKSKAWAPSLGQFTHVVGLFAQMTTVTAEGITTRVLKRYPDRVGQPVFDGRQRSSGSGFGVPQFHRVLGKVP